MNSTLTLTQEWDKTFPQNEAVDHCKVTFHNRFGIELAADLYKPKGAQGPFAADGGDDTAFSNFQIVQRHKHAASKLLGFC